MPFEMVDAVLAVAVQRRVRVLPVRVVVYLLLAGRLLAERIMARSGVGCSPGSTACGREPPGRQGQVRPTVRSKV